MTTPKATSAAAAVFGVLMLELAGWLLGFDPFKISGFRGFAGYMILCVSCISFARTLFKDKDLGGLWKFFRRKENPDLYSTVRAEVEPEKKGSDVNDRASHITP